MRESSLPVWAIILFCSAVIDFILGFIRPHITKDDRLEMKKFFKKDKPIKEGKLTIKLKSRFSAAAFAIVMILATVSALIAFFVESFVGFADSLGGGVVEYAFVLMGALFGIPVLEGAFLLIAVLIEEKIASNNVAYYERRYNVEIMKR